ncbi:MAG: peroxide stress protein YaaA, partial [Psychroserpens sp.]|nr:peroxide stress protein YaaA [Psychroserpens sp.]
ALKVPVINIKFQELKDGAYKTIGIFSKLGRGLMTRYIIDTNAKTIEDIKGFDYDNYRYAEALSSEQELVFTR